MNERLLCFTTTILSVVETPKKKKKNSEPNHVWLYTKSLNVVSSTHPTYDAELLRPLDHQPEDAPNRLVGQMREVGRWDSWGAVGTLLKGTSM